jgi:hypothetical protein
MNVVLLQAPGYLLQLFISPSLFIHSISRYELTLAEEDKENFDVPDLADKFNTF